MRLTATECHRPLLLGAAAEPARARRARGPRIGVPEATALVADPVREAARGRAKARRDRTPGLRRSREHEGRARPARQPPRSGPPRLDRLLRP
ncbi:urease subunit gamma [Streptomyces sp. ODS05-4]|uniref:urease subunit gamma n=1 Tax=Streptomyces sp. ODS05-4 TaxID=2944939 RepID=UPI0035AEBF23